MGGEVWMSTGPIHTKNFSIMCDGGVDMKNYSPSKGPAPTPYVLARV